MGSQEDERSLLEDGLLQNDGGEIYSGDGSVDIKGRPVLKQNTGNWKACPFILGTECCERLAYYGIATNLVTYLTRKLHEGNVSAARNVTTWQGTCYLTPLIGAILADAYWGRYWTIAVFSTIYFIGMCTLTLSASVSALKPAECFGSVPKDSSLLYETQDKGSAIEGSRKLEHSNELTCLDKAAVLSEPEVSTGNFSNPWRLCTVTQVEELKILIRMFPIWATGIVFSAVYAQMSTLFVEQGTMMDTTVGSFSIPPASLSTFDVISVIFWVPVYDRVIVPIARKFTGKERGFSELQRMGIGLFLSILCMSAAAVVEIIRLRIARELGLVDQQVAVPLSIFWQIPQYFLLGAAEIFTFIGQLEFFYDQSPDAMRSLCSALSLLTTSLGNYLSSFILTIVTYITTKGGKTGWIPDNLNEGHLDYFFWLLAGLSFLNMLVYIVFAGSTIIDNLTTTKILLVFILKIEVEPTKQNVKKITMGSDRKEEISSLKDALLLQSGVGGFYAGDGSVDFKGKPVLKNKSGNWKACSFILGTFFCERLAFYGISTNLVNYLIEKLHQGNVSAARNVTTWQGTCYLTPLIGAILADTYWGRYWTIAGFTTFYLTGLCTITLSASVPALKPAKCTPFYRFQKSGGSPLTRICQVLVASFRKRNVAMPGDSNLLFETQDISSAIKGSRKLKHSDELRCLDKAAVLSEPEVSTGNFSNPWRLCTVTQVEELKILILMFPIWATGIVFSAVYAQMSTLFVEQGTMMDTAIGSFSIPPASLSTFDVISVIFLVPVYDRVIVPIARKFTGKERGFSELQRMGIGLFLSILCMSAAAVGEIIRLRIARELGLVDQEVAVPLSIFWQIPQYFLLGAAEIFTFIGQLEFFNDQSPDAMRSLCSALSLLTTSLGNNLSSFILTVVTYITTKGGKTGWIRDNLNEGHLDYFFWLLARLSFLNMLVYIVFAGRYEAKKAS
ncbi:hypothetical protein FEM48_Zijuj10G0026900 [Ziziphus jujuba var. spinosa]|uniref:Protein NRT1/ PTR FAMILY 8.3-like n=1 Tax=Ziziphus jujuba var. spinosa TaxID=714518 RepID=A0A978UKU2_ZIZJJ|nr:hypothetical protein FEM48_Zijuj10G0026900 [Ziziphus jujuba var. spinosa]